MRNFTVGRVWQIPIRLNVSLFVFLPVLAWLVGSGEQLALYAALIDATFGTSIDVAALQAGATPWLVGGVAAVGLFASVTLHELGHSWAAMRYGFTVESITLWILGGLASLQAMPEKWDQELVVALAGPITSVLVAAGAAMGLLLTPAGAPVAAFVFGWLAVTNLVLAGFNMLPAFPMDGGRVLRALLARTRPFPVATRTAARVGSLFALLFAVVGVLSFSPMLVLLAVFVYGGATAESRLVVVGDLLEGTTVADVGTVPAPTVTADATVNDLLVHAVSNDGTAFPVVDSSGEVVGVVTLGAAKGVGSSKWESTRVADVMTLGPPTVDAADDAFEALSAMNVQRAGAALVTDGDGPPGVVTRDQFAEALSVLRTGRNRRVANPSTETVARGP